MNVIIGNLTVFDTLQYQSVGLCCRQLASLYQSQNTAGSWNGVLEIVVKTFLFVVTDSSSTFDLEVLLGVNSFGVGFDF